MGREHSAQISQSPSKPQFCIFRLREKEGRERDRARKIEQANALQALGAFIDAIVLGIAYVNKSQRGRAIDALIDV